MDGFECVATKLDLREFDSRSVPDDVKLKVLEAGRLSGSGMNNQHWRFVLVAQRDDLKKLAADSTTGQWVENANFAVIVLTNPKYGFHLIDAGRAVQDMQLAAWNFGVVSCIFTGVNRDALQRDFTIPNDLSASVIAGFGYPRRSLSGKRKNRKPLQDLAFSEKYGKPLGLRTK